MRACHCWGLPGYMAAAAGRVPRASILGVAMGSSRECALVLGTDCVTVMDWVSG